MPRNIPTRTRGRLPPNSAARTLLAAAFCALAAPGAGQSLDGHGGPVMGLAISPDGRQMLSASFDYSIGYRALDGGAPVWLEGHRAAVNAVRFIDAGRAVSGADDYDLGLWNLADGTMRRLERHQGKVMSVAVSPDRALVASAGWDGAVGLWSAQSGALLHWLTGHRSRVNDVAFSPAGDLLYSGSDDGTIRVWDAATGEFRRLLTEHGFGVNRIVPDPEGRWIALGAVDGRVRVIDAASAETVADIAHHAGPVLALALDAPSGRLAAGYAGGDVLLLDTRTWTVGRVFRAARAGPVWALAFGPDGRLYSAGLDSAIAVWDPDAPSAAKGPARHPFARPPAEMENGERQFVRKCSICHSLGAGPDRRAGPPLGGLFGRRAGGFDGYGYSRDLRGADLTWSARTIDALFREGPEIVVPGSKMPMQRIVAARDRRDLIEYLRRATRLE